MKKVTTWELAQRISRNLWPEYAKLRGAGSESRLLWVDRNSDEASVTNRVNLPA